MASTSFNTICAYLDKAELKYKINDDNSLMFGIVGHNSDTELPIVIRLVEHWISFTVYMLLSPANDVVISYAARKIGEWNYVMKLAKFAVSPDKGIILSVELPLECLTYEFFLITLETLFYYADFGYPHLVKLWNSGGTISNDSFD